MIMKGLGIETIAMANGQVIRYREGWSWVTLDPANAAAVEAADYADEIVILSAEMSSEMLDYEQRLQADIDWRIRQPGWDKMICPNTGEEVSVAFSRTSEGYPYRRIADNGTPIACYPSSKKMPDWHSGIIYRKEIQ